jgi:SAM-dependent methyltransferase
MPRIDSDTFYTASMKKFGTTARGLHWLSQESQTIRFEMIMKLLPDDLSAYTLVDAGCGFADLYHFLVANGLTPKSYLGVDSHKDICSIASEKSAQHILHADLCRDRVQTADYYVCSGALNILTPFETHLFIANCYKSSKKGFIFNALHADKESQTYNYLCKEEIEKIAQELKVREVVFQSGYLEDDITVGFYR